MSGHTSQPSGGPSTHGASEQGFTAAEAGSAPYQASPPPGVGNLDGSEGSSGTEGPAAPPAPARQPGWIYIAAAGLGGVLLGAMIGVAATDPTGSSEYLELASAREELQVTNSELQVAIEELEGQVAAVEGERDDAIRDHEDAVAGADEREGQLDTREAELDEQTLTLDQQSAALDARSTELDERSAALDAREADISALESFVEESSFGSGTLLVGTQVSPGTYAAPGGGNCYWERLSGTSGEFGDIIANDWVPNNSQVLVTISSSDVAFSSSDCGTWTLLP